MATMEKACTTFTSILNEQEILWHDQFLVSIEAADGMVLKHQAISIHNTDSVFIVQVRFHKNCYL